MRPYIGLPFADKGRGPAFDCWGLVRHVLHAEQGLLLPDYGDRYAAAADQPTVSHSIRAGLVEGWGAIAVPQPWALVIFKIANKPWHVGLMLQGDRFLHIPPHETSCTERLSAARWVNRIEGFYARQQ